MITDAFTQVYTYTYTPQFVVFAYGCNARITFFSRRQARAVAIIGANRNALGRTPVPRRYSISLSLPPSLSLSSFSLSLSLSLGRF